MNTLTIDCSIKYSQVNEYFLSLHTTKSYQKRILQGYYDLRQLDDQLKLLRKLDSVKNAGPLTTEKIVFWSNLFCSLHQTAKFN